MQLVVLQHERYTCTRSLTFVFAAKLICANRPLRPFKLLFDGVYALRAVTSKSNRNSNGALQLRSPRRCPRSRTESRSATWCPAHDHRGLSIRDRR